jgi:lactam utilization protein B
MNHAKRHPMRYRYASETDQRGRILLKACAGFAAILVLFAMGKDMMVSSAEPVLVEGSLDTYRHTEVIAGREWTVWTYTSFPNAECRWHEGLAQPKCTGLDPREIQAQRDSALLAKWRE